jgi:hypothetical protein
MKYLALTLVLAISSPLFAEEANSLSDAEKKAGWKLLFDGKTVKGWNSWKTKKPLEAGAWKAVNGELAITGRGGGDIYTADTFENFEFSVDWKTSGNSGILFRVNPKAGGPIYGVAPEIQVERKAGMGKHSPGALYDITANEVETVVNADGWNNFRMKLVNGEGTHWLNGKKLYSYKIGSDDWNKRIAGSKWRNAKGYAETANGHLGFQDHGAKVSFRNVKIRSIDGK